MTALKNKYFGLYVPEGEILTSIDPKRLVGAVSEGRHRECVGAVKGTSSPDREAEHSIRVGFDERELRLQAEVESFQ